MAYYLYKLKDNQGRVLSGVAESESETIKGHFSNMNFFVLSCQSCNLKKLFNSQVPIQTLIMFTHRLASLVECGVPILSGMHILWRQTENKVMQLVISFMKGRLEGGNQISAAMEDFPKIFPSLYRTLVRVGETSAELVAALNNLSAYLEYRQQIISRVKKALMYPIIVAAFSTLVLIFMFVMIVPVFEKVLKRLDVALPPLTVGILKFSYLLRNPVFILGLLGVAVGVFFGYPLLRKSRYFSRLIDQSILKVPYFGQLIYMAYLAQIVRAFCLLVGSGVAVVPSLALVETVIDNTRIMADLQQIRTQVEHGTSLYEAFSQVRGLPVMLVEMVGVGEASGMLVPSLERVSKHYDNEVDYQINRLLTYLEPVLIIFVGGVVLVTLLSIYLPIINVWQAILRR